MLRPLIALCTLVVLLTCCKTNSEEVGSPSTSSSQEPTHYPGRTHPLSEKILSDEEVDHVIEEGTKGEEDAGRLFAIGKLIRKAKLVRTFGDSSGSKREMIGEVQDAALTNDNRVFVLDSEFNRVMVYSKGGPLEWTFGRPGNGPNELATPWNLENTENGLWLITDRRAGIKIYRREDTTMSYVKTLPPAYLGEDMCTVNSYVFSNRWQINRVSLSANDTTSFGEVYQAANPIVRSTMSERKLACSPTGPTIVSVFRYLPILRGYTPEGALRWTTKIANISPLQMKEASGPEGQPAADFESSGVDDQVVTVTSMPGGFILIQVERSTEESRKANKEYGRLMTYLVSVQSGNGLYVTDSLPYIYDTSENAIVTASNYPYPQVKLFKLSDTVQSRLASL